MSDSDLYKKIPPGFISSLGEFMVFSKIKEIDNEAKLMSGHTGADIELSSGRKIEVKTSTFNSNENFNHWGFGGIKPEKFHYLICVALDDSLNPKFFIFTRNEAKKFPTEKEAHEGRTTRFNSSKGLTFHLFKKEDENSQPSAVLKEINRNIKDHENRWDKINLLT